MATLISHFYNEQYLLPWWLMHHVPLFDHGILINRGSTDSSVGIIRKLAPHWEIRDSKVPDFHAVKVDREVMNIEKQVSGWKMVLNTTEFLVSRYRNQLFAVLDSLGGDMYSIRTITMIDPPGYYHDPVYALPLVKQRYHGLFPADPNALYNGRFIHKHRSGDYTAGRHWTTKPYEVLRHPAFIMKFSFSPWNGPMRARKLQIAPTIPQDALRSNMGGHHLYNSQELEALYMASAVIAEDMRHIPEFRAIRL
ncbi:glycosyltransferase family 2 protein [Paenibacillus glycanilyticus]|uniref:glycosyltransferase family 2 protein n=1 Tax=Paenibacillus glycanilyticus TaxID=126569 RepID=UPI00203B6A50|nr:glycosyltransferase family 2 protein [Paenibacillus glycanilyticus]MCM3627080.1 glycosyltransferase family 2 protein [Paenibacillus glycanilyticus]